MAFPVLPSALHALSQLGQVSGLYLILNFEMASGMQVTFGHGIDRTLSQKTDRANNAIMYSVLQ